MTPQLPKSEPKTSEPRDLEEFEIKSGASLEKAKSMNENTPWAPPSESPVCFQTGALKFVLKSL